MKMIKGISVLAMMAAASVAMAATLGVTWQNATQNTDGSAIPTSGPGSLTTTIVEYGPCNAARDALASVTGTLTTAYPGTASSAEVPPGTWCGRAKHVNTYGEESGWTSVASVVKAAPKPNPPANFSFGS